MFGLLNVELVVETDVYRGSNPEGEGVIIKGGGGVLGGPEESLRSEMIKPSSRMFIKSSEWIPERTPPTQLANTLLQALRCDYQRQN